MKKNISIKIAVILLVLLPTLAFAQAFSGLTGWIASIRGIVSSLYTLSFGLAMLFFMWSMAQVILKSGDPKAKEEARTRMIWGIVALFIMFSIYGILNWIGDELEIDVGGTPTSTTSSGTPLPPGTFEI